MSVEMTVDEAAERLFCAILAQFADQPDDDVLEWRRLIDAIGEMCRVHLTAGELIQIDEEITFGELRRRMRHGRERLASQGPSSHSKNK